VSLKCLWTKTEKTNAWGGGALNHINSFQIYKLDGEISKHNYYAFDLQKQKFSLCCHLVGNIDMRGLDQSKCLQIIIQISMRYEVVWKRPK